MLLYKQRVQLVKTLIKNYRFYKVYAASLFIKPGDKILYLEVTGIQLNRYLYNFLKFFQLSGYTVYLPKNKEIVNLLSRKKGEFVFALWLLEEGFIKFGEPANKESVLKIYKENISNDYFASLGVKNEHRSYHVPMSEYPVLYRRYKWREVFNPNKKRKRSLFMIGNIDRDFYYNIGRRNFFDIISRGEVVDFIVKKDYYLPVLSVDTLNNFLDDTIDEKAIIIDTNIHFQIGGEDLKRVLKQFAFYLGLPGIIIPQSHNLIEAMSVGSIPVIHLTYSNLFSPPLENKVNAIIYESLDELDDCIQEIFNYKEEQIIQLRINTYNYYKEFLTPEAVVGNIEKHNYENIYLQAEGYSLKNINKISSV